MTSFVRIALAGGAGSFAEVNIVEGDTISRLVERACAKFPHWGTADKLFLYLVAAGGDEEPADEAISAVLSSGGRLGVGWSLEDAGIVSGAWLVAHRIADGGASFTCHARACPIMHTASLRLDLHRPPTLTFLPQSRRAFALPSAQTLSAVSLLH